MLETKKNKAVIFLTVPLLLGVAATSLYSLLAEDFYLRETPNWALQSWGQDIINIALVCPVLFFASVMAYTGRKSAMLIWAGVNLYLAYTFAIYAFAIHFNELFLVYCINFGLAFYACAYFIYWAVTTHPEPVMINNRLMRITSIFFFFLSVVFYLLWLSAVIPELSNTEVPQSLIDTGLMTNPVHVIDLSVFLPGMCIVAILLWRKVWMSYVLTPLLLTFLVLMNLTIGFLHALMFDQGMAGNPALIYVMVGLSVFCLVLLNGYVKAFSAQQPNPYGITI